MKYVSDQGEGNSYNQSTNITYGVPVFISSDYHYNKIMSFCLDFYHSFICHTLIDAIYFHSFLHWALHTIDMTLLTRESVVPVLTIIIVIKTLSVTT